MTPDIDPAALAFALATLRAEGDDEAAAELLHDAYGSHAATSESVLREHGSPPFPGAVLTGDPPRWHHPVTGEEHPTDAHHPHDEQATGTALHDSAPEDERGRFGKIRQALVDRLSKSAGGRAVLSMGRGGLWLFHKIEHRLLFVAKKTQAIAVEAARQRGLPDDRVPALQRALYIADFLGGYATGFGALAVAGPLAGKTAAVMPSVSVAYLAYSTARDPKATWAAAKKVIGDTFAKGSAAHESVTPELAARLADRLKAVADPDWYLALLHAAAGQTDGDMDRAIELADQAVADQPTAPDAE